MATIKDIATRLGVSVSTVSKGLNGASDISEELRQMVLDTAVPAAAHSFTLCAVPYPFFFSCRVPVPPSTTPSWSSTATMVPKKHFTSMPKLRCST